MGKGPIRQAEDGWGWGCCEDVQRLGDLCWREPKKAQFVSQSPNLVDVFLKLLKVNSHAVIHYREIRSWILLSQSRGWLESAI